MNDRPSFSQEHTGVVGGLVMTAAAVAIIFGVPVFLGLDQAQRKVSTLTRNNLHLARRVTSISLHCTADIFPSLRPMAKAVAPKL